MKINKWEVLLIAMIFLAVSANELGFGLIAFIALAPPAYWLMTKTFA